MNTERCVYCDGKGYTYIHDPQPDFFNCPKCGSVGEEGMIKVNAKDTPWLYECQQCRFRFVEDM